MKRHLRSLLPSLWFTLAFSMGPALAQSPAPVEGHYEKVAPHLNPGGLFYSYVDIENDALSLAKIGDMILESAREEAGGALPPGLTASGIIKALGIDRLKAFGLSSRKAEDGLIHNRGFFYLPEGRTGLFKLFGGDAAPFQSPRCAPAGSDLVIETDLTLGAVLDLVEAVLTSTGDEQYLQVFKSALSFPVPHTELKAGDFISQLNTKIILAGRLEKGITFKPDEKAPALPAFRLVACFDGLEFLAAPLFKLAAESGEMKIEQGDGFEAILPREALPEALSFFKPLIYHDLKSKRLLIGTHREGVTEFLTAAHPISSDPDFIKAIAGLATEGNDFSYLTPGLLKAVNDLSGSIIREAMADLEKLNPSGGTPGHLKSLLEALQSFSPVPNQALTGLRANLKDGILFQSNSTSSYKTILLTATVVPVALVASASFAGFSRIKQAQLSGPASPDLPREAAEAEPAADDDHPDEGADAATIRANLQQIAFAAQSWFVDHPDATEVSYNELIEAELLFRIKPVNGESYQDLKLQKTGGTLSVKPKDGAKVSRDYGAAEK